MIASFFRHLEEHRVRWLLVSGQATILYGAATFSEDIDLWVEPGPENLTRLVGALRASNASYYKLTPALTADLASRHHGFHFTVPDADPNTGAGAPMYLDVMGCPPRVGPFEDAAKRSRIFETHWGSLNTVAIRDLVELKKTQRPRDYPIISRLALVYLRDEATSRSDEDLSWALDNTFSLSAFKELAATYTGVGRVVENRPLLRRAVEQLRREDELSPALEDELESRFDDLVAPLKKADRYFWRSVIEELKQLRSRGELMQEGAKV